MSETMETIERPDESASWAAARRIESWAGEIRVNRLRLAAIIVFYVRFLIDFYVNRANRAALGKYYSTPELRIPWSTEVIWLLAMCVAGLLAGQVVRQMRRISAGYAVAMGQEGKG